MEKTFLYNYQKINEKSMNRYRLTFLWTISILLTLTLICISETSTAKNNDGMLILTEKTNSTKNTQNLDLSLRMIETSTGITMSVHYKENEKQKQAIDNQAQLGPDLISGGEIKLFIDDNLLIQTYFNTGKIELDQPVNIELLENGNHTAKCEINTASGEHFSKTVPFTIDASLRLPPFLNHQLINLRWNLQFLFTAADKSVRYFFYATSLYKDRV
ncbi:MAG: hypothetical protein L3J49_14245, partial [Desulfobulbaceae bacterium]|nr:hypothetical protein [Desulfobulbaceae bacterium]